MRTIREKELTKIVEDSNGTFEICQKCGGTGFDFISGNDGCGNCIGRGVIDKEHLQEDRLYWKEVERKDEDDLKKYFQQHPEARVEWEKGGQEDAEAGYGMISEYSEAFPEYLDKLIKLYPDWWEWKKHKSL